MEDFMTENRVAAICNAMSFLVMTAMEGKQVEDNTVFEFTAEHVKDLNAAGVEKEIVDHFKDMVRTLRK